MPPPKRPKSDVRWTALCSEAESRLPERTCGSVEDNSFHAASVTVHCIDNNVAKLSSGSSTPSTELVAVVSNDAPLDLRRTDVVTAGDRHDTGDATGSRQLRSSTTLRQLLLEPLTSASDLYRSLPTTSSPASASTAAAGTHRGCRTTGAYVGTSARCRTSLNGVPAAARAWRTDIGSSSSLPSIALRPILLDDDDNVANRNHPQRSVTTSVCQSSDCLFVRLPSSGSGLDRSPGYTIVRALPQQSITSSDSRDCSQIASSLPSKCAQLTGRLESHDSNVSSEQPRKTSNSLK